MLAATAITWGGMFPIMKPLLGKIDPFTPDIGPLRLCCDCFLLILAAEVARRLPPKAKTGRLCGWGRWDLQDLGYFSFSASNNARPEFCLVITSAHAANLNWYCDSTYSHLATLKSGNGGCHWHHGRHFGSHWGIRPPCYGTGGAGIEALVFIPGQPAGFSTP